MKKIKNALKELYVKLFKIDDTPAKIALGFGIGVFSGILPGTGPLAALFLAFIFRVNRASALLGSLLTNTWISILAFLLALQVGSAILGNVKWLGAKEIILPVIVGFLVVSLVAGLLAYLSAFIVIILFRKFRRRKGGSDENKS